ncbi:MAG: GvpL/GvpF family gas vesicle protein [Chloroflexi bacterium]|nr:GvpL/GvpF family gas vesicle protein [Chloroflexota bacterium]
MTENGKGNYLYCIVKTECPLRFVCSGVNEAKEEVYTVHAGELAAVTSRCAADTYHFNRSTAIAHQLVIQEVMRRFTVLPVSFGVAAQGEKAIQELLERHRQQFLSQLTYLDNKAEYGVKALWKDKDLPFRQILEERDDIRRYRDEIARRRPSETYEARIQIGRLVQEALVSKRESETRRIVERLKPLAADARVNTPRMDQMVVNAAFLLVKGAETAFDVALQELDKQYDDQMRFRLVGPSPPFNFVNMPISW